MYLNYTHPDQIRDVFKSIDDEDVENIRFYMTDGCDPDMRDDSGHTLLIYAMMKKKYHAAETLLEMGADPDLTIAVTGHSALHYAAGDNHAHLVGVLAHRKADLNLQDNFGWAPLHMAAGKGRLDALQALVEAGADLSLRDTQRERPLDIAQLRAEQLVPSLAEPYKPVVAYLREQMQERGIEFISREERAAGLANDISELKKRNPNRFKFHP